MQYSGQIKWVLTFDPMLHGPNNIHDYTGRLQPLWTTHCWTWLPYTSSRCDLHTVGPDYLTRAAAVTYKLLDLRTGRQQLQWTTLCWTWGQDAITHYEQHSVGPEDRTPAATILTTLCWTWGPDASSRYEQHSVGPEDQTPAAAMNNTLLDLRTGRRLLSKMFISWRSINNGWRLITYNKIRQNWTNSQPILKFVIGISRY